MTTINDVDFGRVTGEALKSARAVFIGDWENIKDIVETIAKNLTNDIDFIAKKKLSGEFDETDARIFLEDQKTVARIRLRSVAIVTLQIAERVWNAIADVFRGAIRTALSGWVVL